LQKTIDDTILPFFGHLGIEQRAKTLLINYSEHHASYYDIITLPLPREIEDFKIVKYICLSDYGRVKFHQMESTHLNNGNSLLHNENSTVKQ